MEGAAADKAAADKAAADPFPVIDKQHELDYARDYYSGLGKVSEDLLETLGNPSTLDWESAKECMKTIENGIDDSLLTYKYKKVPLYAGNTTEIPISNISKSYSEISKDIEFYKNEIKSSFSPQTGEEIVSLIEKIRKWAKELNAYSKAKLAEIASFSPSFK